MPKHRRSAIKRPFAQSTYITAAWNWFLILAGKAAEPVLVASVLYASVKLLPVVRFPPPFDVVVFIAQFVALDVGGLSLNKLADQAKKDGNEEGAKHARRLSLALVAIMLVGVIMAGVDQIIRINGQLGTVIDTILLIARAVMAVLYSRVIHSLKKDDEPELPGNEKVEEWVTEKVETVLTGKLEQMRQDMVSQFEASLSQYLNERLTELEAKQAAAMAHLKQEQQALIAETVEATIAKRFTDERETRGERPTGRSSKVRSITEAASRKRAAAGGPQEIDKVIWPLLNSGMTVRAIAARAETSTATVGRSRQRWEKANRDVSDETEDDETAEA